MPVIFILSLAYVLSQFYRGMLAVLTPVLSQELGMTTTDLSNASALWFATFALAQFPIGYLLDTKGPRLTASLLFGVFGGGGMVLFSQASEPNHIIIAMGSVGIGCAPVLMSTFMVFARKFRIELFATLSSTFVSVGLIGSVLGSQPLVIAVEALGWRNCALGLAAISVFLAILLFVMIKTPAPTNTPQKGSFWQVLSIRAMWPIFPLIFVAYATAASIRGLWIAPLLLEVHSATIHQIGMVTLTMSIAQIVGTLAYGPLDRIFGTRKWLIFIGNLFVVVPLAMITFNVSMPVMTFSILVFAIGMFSASYAVQMAHGSALIPDHITGRGMTLMNFFSIGGAGFMQYVTGHVVNNADVIAPGMSAYSVLFGFYTLVLSVALIIYLFCQDTKPGQKA